MFGKKFENYDDAKDFAEQQSIEYPNTKFYIVVWTLADYCEISDCVQSNENIGTETYIYFMNGEEYDA